MKRSLGKRGSIVRRLSVEWIYRWLANQPEQLWLGVLALIVMISRWVGHSQFLYSADAVKYALALDKYDISIHQPHPLGYALYILLAKPIYWLVGDANLALIIVSIIFSVGALYALYYLAKKVYGPPTAWVAVILFMFSPVVWFYGQVALNYLADALFMAWFGHLAYQALSAKQPAPGLVTWASVIFAIGGGFRPTLMLFMAPLWLWMIWRQRSWRTAVLNCAIIVVLTLSWVWPAAALSGGWLKFWQAIKALLFTPGAMDSFISLNHGLSAVWDQLINKILGDLLVNFNLSGAVLILFLALLATPVVNAHRVSLFNLYFWLALIMPASLFYIFGVYALTGYLLVIIPGLTVLIAKALTVLVDTAVLFLVRRSAVLQFWRIVGLTLAVIGLTVGNLWLYLRPSRQVIESLRPAHSTLYTMDRLWSSLIPTLRQEFNPQNTIIVIDQPFMHWGIEHFQYYFPGYTTYQRIAWGIANPDHKNWYRAYDQQFKLVDNLELLPGDKWMVLVRKNWNDLVTNKLLGLALPGQIGNITYYDLSVPSIREFLAQADHVELINSTQQNE